MRRLLAATLGEQLVVALLGGAGVLLLEIRFEHSEVVGETWHAWLPLGYLLLFLVVGTFALLRFHRGGRRVLALLFGLAVAIGGLGLWFHAAGHPLSAAAHVARAWLLAPGRDAGVGEGPPALAPMAFVGLGLLGLIACRRT